MRMSNVTATTYEPMSEPATLVCLCCDSKVEKGKDIMHSEGG